MKQRVLGFFLFFSVLFALTGCEENEFDRDWNAATATLCQYSWLDEYIDNNGNSCSQELIFYPDGTGMDITTIYYAYQTNQQRTAFFWDWDLQSGYFTSFYLSYPDGTDYFDNVQFGNGSFRALLNGTPVVFNAIYK